MLVFFQTKLMAIQIFQRSNTLIQALNYHKFLKRFVVFLIYYHHSLEITIKKVKKYITYNSNMFYNLYK